MRVVFNSKIAAGDITPRLARISDIRQLGGLALRQTGLPADAMRQRPGLTLTPNGPDGTAENLTSHC